MSILSDSTSPKDAQQDPKFQTVREGQVSLTSPTPREVLVLQSSKSSAMGFNKTHTALNVAKNSQEHEAKHQATLQAVIESIQSKNKRPVSLEKLFGKSKQDKAAVGKQNTYRNSTRDKILSAKPTLNKVSQTVAQSPNKANNRKCELLAHKYPIHEINGHRRAYKFQKKTSQEQGCNTEEQDFVDMMIDSKLLRGNNNQDKQQIDKCSEASPATNQNEVSPLLDRNREKLLQRQISEYKPAT